MLLKVIYLFNNFEIRFMKKIGSEPFFSDFGRLAWDPSELKINALNQEQLNQANRPRNTIERKRIWII